MLSEALYTHAFASLPGFEPQRLRKIRDYFGNFAEAFRAISAGVNSELGAELTPWLRKIDLDRELTELERQSIHLLTPQDPGYPKLLLEIHDYPLLLYHKGNIEPAGEPRLAVVGTRLMTAYTAVAMSQIIRRISETGVTIVSGLAYGVDAAAHKTALDSGSRTIAVLPGGLDDASICPRDHGLLADRIVAAGGALISEYAPGTPGLKHHFLARNRIIAGMASGTLVVECPIKSGAMITARHALEQNRNVYAIPGPIHSKQSVGPNSLIKQGAKPVTEPTDILEDFRAAGAIPAGPDTQKRKIKINTLTPNEQLLLKYLTSGQICVDSLIKLSGQNAAAVSVALTYLEIKGIIRRLGAAEFALGPDVTL